MSDESGPAKVKISTATGQSVTNIYLRNGAPIQDILYVPEIAAAIPIPQKGESKFLAGKQQNVIAQAYERIKEESELLASHANTLVQAKSSLTATALDQTLGRPTPQQKTVLAAQSAMRTAMYKVATQADLAQSSPSAAQKAAPPLKSAEPALIEVYSLQRKQMLLIARETLKKCETRNEGQDNVFYVYQSETTRDNAQTKETRKKTVTQRPDLTLRDAMKFFRPAEQAQVVTGELDFEAIKKAWQPVKQQIAAEWNIGALKKAEGQIPSKLIAYAVSKEFAHFFDDDDYKAIDAFIAAFNESAKVKWQKYEEERKELVKSLSKKGFSPDDWKKLVSQVKDIWWGGWREKGLNARPDNSYHEFAYDIEETKYQANTSFLRNVAQRIAQEPLPPVMWDASAGAQLMRYSAGATGKAEFNVFETGRLGISGNAKANFNLIEGKADVGCYLPDSNGKELIVKLPIRKTEGIWSPLKINGKVQHFFGENTAQFEFDKSIVSPRGVFELSHVFTGWDAASKSVQHLLLNASNEPMVVQVIGHTDAVGKETYNLKLSQRRARAAAALLSDSTAEWITFFREGIWKEYELKLMLFYVLCEYEWKLPLDWRLVESHDDFTRELNKPLHQRKITSHSQLLGLMQTSTPSEILQSENTGQLVQRFQKMVVEQRLPFVANIIMPATDGRCHPKTENGLRTLSWLVHAYFYGVKREVQVKLPNAKFTDNISLYTEQTQGLGETQLRRKTQSRLRENRRIELLAWAKTDEINHSELADYNFGAVRLHLTGSISGEAGANLNLGGSIGFDVSKHALLAGGTIAAAMGKDVKLGRGAPDAIQQNTTIYEKTTEFTEVDLPNQQTLPDFNTEAGAFAGAKAEANIKAAVDWRPPLDAQRAKTLGLKPAAQIHEFLTLGDVGYMATAMAGVGLKGTFKIGFDDETKRFQIKISAEASLGLGFGGGFSFSVAINYLFDFVKLVYGKLQDNNFHFIDVFENEREGAKIDVYGLFCAISFELLKEGKPFQAGATFAVGNALGLAFEMLEEYRTTVRSWDQAQNLVVNIEQVLETINQKPEHLQYLTPEIKGRLLFVLAEAKIQRKNLSTSQMLSAHIQSLWQSNNRLQDAFDYNGDVERAALTLIEQGVHSPRDWQKTLQNMLSIDAQGNLCAPNGCDGDITTKVTLAIDNEIYLTKHLLDEEKDRDALDSLLKSKGIVPAK